MHSLIEPLEARIAPATFLVTSGADSGANTLRQAILSANAQAGADTIQISVAVMPTSALPAITDVTLIDGTNSGAGINGALAGAGGIDGLVFTGAHTGSSVSDLFIIGFSGDGLVMANGGGGTIHELEVGGFGVPADSVGGHGIVLQSAGNTVFNCEIGGVGGNGIHLEGVGADNNLIEDNVVLGDIGGAGILVGEGSGNVIEQNFVGGTTNSGIVILGSTASGNAIQFNNIGVDDDFDPLPVGLAGIFLGSAVNTVQSNFILNAGTHGIQVQGGLGGANLLSDNLIQECVQHGVLVEVNGGAEVIFNKIIGHGGDGVRVTGVARATIIGNVFADNTGLAIDLGGDGPTANDAGTPPDTDTGPNDLQNRPVIVEAVALSGNGYVRGELRSTPNSEFTIDLVVPGEDSFGVFVKASTQQLVMTDANGFATFVLPTQDYVVRPHDTYFVTATNAVGLGATSEAVRGEFEVGEELVRILGPTKATWTDVDGDKVTLTVSKGALDYDAFITLPEGKGTSIGALVLGAEFNRANVTVSVKKAGGGDGEVALGFLGAGEINLGTVKIKGSLTGLDVGRDGTTQSLEMLNVSSLGVESDAGSFRIAQNVRRIVVGGSMVDCSFTIGGRVQEGFSVKRDFVDATINADRIAAFSVGGNVRAETRDAGLQVARTIGTVNVKGSMEGSGMFPVTIAAGGVIDPLTDDLATALRSLTVGGDLVRTNILAGYRFAPFPISVLQPANADVQIGTIAIRGDFTASNISAGVMAGLDGQFGTADDALIPGGSGDIVARIASIAIGGDVAGGGMATFGIVAQEVGSFRVGRTALPLTDGLDDLAIDGAPTVRLREV